MTRFREQLSYQIARTISATYIHLALPLIKQRYTPADPETGANQVHELVMKLCAIADESVLAQVLIKEFYKLVYEPLEGEYKVGGVILPSDMILAAGWIKGLGFENQQQAEEALAAGENLIPGYFSFVQASGGVAEFGSYTNYPRVGNDYPSVWRQEPGSVQNRVGLTNPGSWAAAQFMQDRSQLMPKVFGVNVAVTPGIEDDAAAAQDIRQSFANFLRISTLPTWFTLNISCPNTEDDVSGNQTDEKVRTLCRAALGEIRASDNPAVQQIPLWIKVGPNLGEQRYRQLMQICAEEGVKAIVATNTRGEPAPHNPNLIAGVSGRKLHDDAVAATKMLIKAKKDLEIESVDIIGCGGVEDGPSYQDFGDEVAAGQWLTALLFWGPTAGVMIREEARRMSDE